jgi:hypothetical protein
MDAANGSYWYMYDASSAVFSLQAELSVLCVLAYKATISLRRALPAPVGWVPGETGTVMAGNE